jgi:crotonobetainyl-CoA:carnitine CoA-transferase CaiB-like acyl-CoA transferase
MPRPLDGIRVLDLTHYLAGPYLTVLLAALGAEVLKIERPETGDEARSFGSGLLSAGGLSDYYVGSNHSKRSISIHLDSEKGLDLVRDLAAQSDIIVENFRHGVADQLGVGFDDLRGLRPGLIYTSISGFGADGPWASLPANDTMMQSLSGLMAATGEVGEPPLRLGSSVCDIGAGLFGLAGTLAALTARDRHPEGQHVEVALFDAAIALLPNSVPAASLGYDAPHRTGRKHPQILGQSCHACSDGKYVTIGAFSQKFWCQLVELLGHSEWLDDPRFKDNPSRVANRQELDDEMDSVFLSRPRDEWVERLRAADIPCAPVLELRETLATAQADNNQVTLEISTDESKYSVCRSPIRSKQWGPQLASPAEALGASGRSILRETLGLEDSDIDALVATGAVWESESSQLETTLKGDV